MKENPELKEKKKKKIREHYGFIKSGKSEE